ncbi:hypothetical protein RchiOBHm_Chr6g0266591 [Rosa chinensis]|uniref:Uncharacterized protein n=1 Tax=Rosa chinensis TaxID=74649 RepID=A0A2P6PPQ2_ROSCH|nr:hypothetical protein RchiOBHm_Chr6g0266591 [Rosa chinensis]
MERLMGVARLLSQVFLALSYEFGFIFFNCSCCMVNIVVGVVDRYKIDCISVSSRSVKVIYIQTSGNKTCNRNLMESIVNIDRSTNDMNSK